MVAIVQVVVVVVVVVVRRSSSQGRHVGKARMEGRDRHNERRIDIGSWGVSECKVVCKRERVRARGGGDIRPNLKMPALVLKVHLSSSRQFALSNMPVPPIRCAIRNRLTPLPSLRYIPFCSLYCEFGAVVVGR
jgi:hypothetical protein